MPSGEDRQIDRPRYGIEFLPSAARQLEKLPIADQAQVAVAIDGLSDDPSPDDAKLLSPRIAVRVPRSLHDRVMVPAAKEGRSISEIVRNLLENYAHD